MAVKSCTCPPGWERYYHDHDCPAYESCGGWTWDPPCGGCDWCMAAQDAYGRMLEAQERGSGT